MNEADKNSSDLPTPPSGGKGVSLRRMLGIVWMALGPVFLYFLVGTGFSEMARNPSLDTRIQWSVFIVIFIPIAIGLAIFGYYAYKGEYDDIY